MTAKSPRGAKRSKILSASQSNAKTSLTAQQFTDELQRDRLSRVQGEDLLLQEQRKIQLRIKALKEDLPHLHGQKYYTWQREFFESRNKINLLCAANQIGKSTCLIKKNVEWAGNVNLWPELWTTPPKMFWYFYPSNQVANVEFEKKWVPEYLPRGAMKSDKNYGWDAEYIRGDLEAVHFKSGVSIYVKTYGQKIINLQTSTVHMISCFTAGHLIITSTGLKRVEDVKVGDRLLGEGGWNTVTQAVVQHAPVSKKEFTNGEVLEATDDHPMWTYNRGWVRFSELTPEDVLATFPGWKIIRKLYLLGERTISETPGVPTLGRAITTAVKGVRRIGSYTWICGNILTRGKFQKVTSFTTKISIRWIILSKIWSSLHALNTREFTRKKSGSSNSLLHISAGGVGQNSYLGVLKRLRITFVNLVGERRSQGHVKCVTQNFFLRKILNAVLQNVLQFGAGVLEKFFLELVLGVMKFFSVGRASLKSIVQETAQTEIKAIHTITVDNSHTYLSNGFYCHNCDEEMPPEFVDELLARLRAVGGYFNQVFTATTGYELWYRAMECIGQEDEAFKTAYKRVISLYDCGQYEDGTPSLWTPQRMAEAEASCTSRKEVLKRIHGRFVKDEGLRYETFDPDRNVRTPEHVPSNWKWYSAVDVGSGGKGRSAGAVVFVAVSPDFTRGRVTRSWRGDYEETTAADILKKFRELRGSTALSQAGYDYASREFGLIASRSGEGFVRADKAKTSGESIVNTLFKTGALTIDAGVFDNHKLVSELMSVPGGAEKNRKFKDDLCFSGDTLIYTSRGSIPIRCVIPGDMVLNRFGWNKVLRTSCRLGETYVFSLNRKLVACTENHKFFSNGDFQAIGDLKTTQGMLFKGVWSYLCQLYQYQLFLREQRTVATLRVIKDTFVSTIGLDVPRRNRVRALFTEISGPITEGLFLKAMLSTIKTGIHLTIALRILNVLVRASICQVIVQKGLLTRSIEGKIRSYWKKLGLSQKSGTLLQKVGLGTGGMGNLYGPMLSKLKSLATIAGEALRPGLSNFPGLCTAQQIVGLSNDANLVSIMKSENAGYVGKIFPSISTIKPRTARALAVQHVPGNKELVYNLAVENHQEYYASGFLVSNCDALRYCIALIPWDFTKISPGASQFMEEQRDEIPQVHWTKEEYAAWEIRQRRGEFETSKKDDWSDFERECAEWNDLYGS